MVVVPTIPKHYCRKVAFFTVLFVACACMVQSSWAAESKNSEAAALVKAYEDETNVIKKRKLLRTLSRETKATGKAVAQWTKDLLQEALGESDPTLVEAAVHQIKMLNLAGFNQKLIDLYHNAGELYANMYDSRVRIGIVTALGITGKADANVVTLFQKILSTDPDKFTYIQGDVLQAIMKLNDPAYLSMVEKYGAFMEMAIAEKKAAGEHLMKYQVLIGYASMCKDIVSTLKKK